jgi:hypothetical protein
VGFFLKGDLERLRESYPWLPLFAPGGGGGGNTSASSSSGGGGAGGGGEGAGGAPLVLHVDLLQLTRAALPKMANLASISLTRLVEQLLGAPLDKAQQRSDWGARPLGSAQRAYAAADAAVLVALFDALAARGAVALGRRVLATMDGGLRALPASPPGEREYPGDAGGV